MSNAELILVDDHFDFRSNTREYLRENGFASDGFDRGEVAHFASDDDQTLRIAVVDSCGFDFAKEQRESDKNFRAIVLCSRTPTVDASFAEKVFIKTSDDWPSELVEIIARLTGEHNISTRESLDVFSDDERARKLQGRIGIVGGRPEEIVAIVDTLSEALDWLKKREDKSLGYRIVQGGPLEPLSQEELLAS